MPVGVFEFRRLKLNIVVHYMLKGRFTQLLHLQKPLQAQFGFDYRIGTFTVTHLIHVIFNLHQVPGALKLRYNLIPGLETIYAHQYLG